MLFCSLIKGITPKIRMSCFVLINSVLFNLLRIWTLIIIIIIINIIIIIIIIIQSMKLCVLRQSQKKSVFLMSALRVYSLSFLPVPLQT